MLQAYQQPSLSSLTIHSSLYLNNITRQLPPALKKLLTLVHIQFCIQYHSQNMDLL